MDFAAKRQLFLTEQGYQYVIATAQEQVWTEDPATYFQ
jgi:hypothetical protein